MPRAQDALERPTYSPITVLRFNARCLRKWAAFAVVAAMCAWATRSMFPTVTT